MTHVSRPRLTPSLPKIAAALLAAALFTVGTAPSAFAEVAGAWPQKEFCGRAQSYITGSTPRVTNTVHDGIESFQRTPPMVQPLTTQQYDWPDERGPSKAASRISCKLVTADRIRAVYGPQAARTEATCEQVNRYTLGVVLGGLTPEERERALFGKGRKVRFERDRLLASPADWYTAYEMASVDGSGRLRIAANALRIDWADPKQAQLPEQSRGLHFCHLIAPDYLRRLLLDPSIVLPGLPPKTTR
jgi:hypothetical protein